MKDSEEEQLLVGGTRNKHERGVVEEFEGLDALRKEKFPAPALVLDRGALFILNSPYL